MREENWVEMVQRCLMTRRQFLRRAEVSTGALAAGTLLGAGPAGARVLREALGARGANTVYLVKNGDPFENVAKLWELLGGVESWIDPTDVVVLKCNGQWPNQGYTHTGCIKAVADEILAIPGFSGEILICDNVQVYGSPGAFGFDAETWNRVHNWPDHNWGTLAAEYQGLGQPVAVKRWQNSELDIAGPGDGEGWMRSFFEFHGRDTYYSYPVFESPLTPGRMIDLRGGVWEGGAGGGYTGRAVKTIVMPNLNNHGNGSSDYAGITSALKSFLGSTEIHYGAGSLFRSHYNWHGTSFSRSRADYAGELTARYLLDPLMYAPVLYITCAIWSGHVSRTGGAAETKTVLACTNPATLDYVACRDVISPHAAYLDPRDPNETRDQILGCTGGGVGTIDPAEFDVVTYDFDAPPPETPALSGAGLVAAAAGLGLLLRRAGRPDLARRVEGEEVEAP